MHKCKTCDGERELLDGSPCPDCYLRTYKSNDIIKLCGNCENSSGRSNMHCIIKDIIVEYSWNGCTFYHVHSRYISPTNRRKYRKLVAKLRKNYEKIFQLGNKEGLSNTEGKDNT